MQQSQHCPDPPSHLVETFVDGSQLQCVCSSLGVINRGARARVGVARTCGMEGPHFVGIRVVVVMGIGIGGTAVERLTVVVGCDIIDKWPYWAF